MQRPLSTTQQFAQPLTATAAPPHGFTIHFHAAPPVNYPTVCSTPHSDRSPSTWFSHPLSCSVPCSLPNSLPNPSQRPQSLHMVSPSTLMQQPLSTTQQFGHPLTATAALSRSLSIHLSTKPPPTLPCIPEGFPTCSASRYPSPRVSAFGLSPAPAHYSVYPSLVRNSPLFLRVPHIAE